MAPKPQTQRTPAEKAVSGPTRTIRDHLADKLNDPEHTLYLLDISSFIFRAFYAIRPLSTKSGEPVNAVLGVATMIARLVDEAHPQYMAVAYDSKEPSFRKEIYPEYKANRAALPEDLIPQFGRIEELMKSFEIHSYRQSGVEADDLIATLTRRWCEASPANRVVVVTSDKDLMQLVNERVAVWDTMNNKVYGAPQVREKFGVDPGQIRDYLALVGDSSDNIPGVPSIGPKTAVDLLNQHGTLEKILLAAGKGEIPGKRGQVIHENEKNARLSAELATVNEELPCAVERKDLAYRFHITEETARLLKTLEFNALLSRWTAEGKSYDSAPHPAQAPEGPEMEAARNLSLLPDAPAAESYERQTLPEGTFRTVDTPELLRQVIGEIEIKKSFGFDVETTSLNPREACLVGVAICTEPGHAWYIPVGQICSILSVVGSGCHKSGLTTI